jgi:hypothetical protein
MADKRISELTALTGANVADTDLLPIVDTSAAETKKITFAEFKTALDTATGFVRITGDTMTGNLSFGDNNKAIFGAGSDLQIYHNGTDSFIREFGTGNLNIDGTNISMRSATGELYIVGTADAGVSIYHNNVLKLATTATGISVTGTVVADGLTVDGGNTIRLNAASGDDFLTIDQGAAEATITANSAAGNANLVLSTTTSGAVKERVHIAYNGDISFYEDTGTTAKFYWDSSAESLGIGTVSPAYTLDVQTASGATLARFKDTDSAYGGIIIAGDTNAGWVGNSAAIQGEGIYYQNSANLMRFYTASDERMRITSTGSVGIGTTSPSAKLDIVSGATYSDIAIESTGGFKARGDGRVEIGESTGANSLFSIQRPSGSSITGLVYLNDVNNSTGLQISTSAGSVSISAIGSSAKINFGNTGVSSQQVVLDTSSGQVGIGTSSPDAILEVDGSASTDGILITNPLSGSFYNAKVEFKRDSTLGGAKIQTERAAAGGVGLSFNCTSTNTAEVNGTYSEAMRIDSSGSLLVAKTAIGIATDGIELNRLDYVGVTRDGDTPLYLNRRTSDGTIAEFRKDNVAVGSIGTRANAIYIGRGDTGISFTDNDDAIYPVSPSGLATRDAAIDLGIGTIRFKNLYLSGGVSNPAAGGTLTFGTVGTERMRIDSSGNVGIGETVPFAKLHISDTQTGRTAAATVGNLLVLEDDNNGMSILSANDGAGYILFGDVASAASGGISYDHTANKFNFRTNDAWDRMTIDSSGNVLVGTTNVNIRDSSSEEGMVYRNGDSLDINRSAAPPLIVNRVGNSDGDLVLLRKDGVTVGSIGAFSGYVYIANNNGDGMALQNNSFRPATNTGANQDNVIDLGLIGSRFDDIYATNGTIQTSDRNEKQDIDVMSEAETRVAVACKGLIRKFRWIDAVAEKGDDARIHFGIIAQDLQDAFAAEGLDAGRYAMFISSTWWETQTDVPAVEAVAEVLDEEGNVVTEAVEAKEAYTRTDTYETLEEAPEGATERTRLGVRYPELLAFIIGAL